MGKSFRSDDVRRSRSNGRGNGQSYQEDNFGNSHDYQPSYQPSHQSQFQERAPRPKMQWQQEEMFEEGSVVAELQSSASDRGGKMFSVCFSRRLGEDRLSKYFRPRDFDNMRRIIGEVQDWIEDQQRDNY